MNDQINDLLQKTLKAHLTLMKKGKREEAFWVLGVGSRLAELQLSIASVACPTCHRLYKDRENIEAVQELGECFSCDHIATDLTEADYV